MRQKTIVPDRREQLRELHENGYRLSKPPACPDKLYRIMRSCWRDDARQRPSFKQLEHTLDNLIQSTRGRDYLDLNPNSKHSSLSFTLEDMDDKMTSVDFVRRHRRQAGYKNNTEEVDQLRLNYTSIGHVVDDVVHSESFPSAHTDGSAESHSQLNSRSTVTSGFQSDDDDDDDDRVGDYNDNEGADDDEDGGYNKGSDV
ncbi:fibroblast growth factor receptor [Plakobranchus ocellatus]|uniref:Fibroblast growth factor receptor n=1 Tax=Plakobranchus ocellatus TaxID=259542 RepID=A0AAV4AG00_9GAST|nr:fibroblast growth factor receptor [Plakobranchus ocellatus]